MYVNVLSGYPMSFTSPEFRVAIRLTRNIDWNLGYQYFKFDDVNTPSQSYAAHLPRHLEGSAFEVPWSIGRFELVFDN